MQNLGLHHKCFEFESNTSGCPQPTLRLGKGHSALLPKAGFPELPPQSHKQSTCRIGEFYKRNFSALPCPRILTP